MLRWSASVAAMQSYQIDLVVLDLHRRVRDAHGLHETRTMAAICEAHHGQFVHTFAQAEATKQARSFDVALHVDVCLG